MVNNVDAQIWLDEKYPKDGVCKRDNDKENKGRRREGITKLDISKGKVGKNNLFSEEKNLTGHLKLKGFTDLRTLVVSSHELTNLDVSECKNLRELDCSNNDLNNLNISSCSNLKKINCVGNNFLKEIDISNCPELTETGSGFTRDTENNKLVKGSLITKAKEDDIRNILVVGITGNGKSTLANVLTDAEQFVEGKFGISETKNFQTSEVFEWQGKKYRIIDNIGFSDTAGLSEEDTLLKIGEGIYSAQEGINQVLFVFKERFAPNQVKAFNIFKNFISDTGITKFTTIVRTGFEDFEDPQECKEDREVLSSHGKEVSEIFKSCRGIIHVDNPPIPITKEKDNEKIRAKKEEKKVKNKGKREESRKIVLNHLAKNCQEIYKLKEWDNIYSLVVEHIKEKEKIEQSGNSIQKKEEELKKEASETTKKIKFRLEADPLTGKAAIEVEYEWKKINQNHGGS